MELAGLALLVLKAASYLKLDDVEMIYYLAPMIDHLMKIDDQSSSYSQAVLNASHESSGQFRMN